jgi:ferritin-like metal-binding protein YciE
LIAWLKDAHAMEAATVDNQARQIRHLADYPELQAKFREHLEESRRHVARLEQCLTQLGADTSLLKDLAMQVTSRVEALVAGATPDEAVKACLVAQAYEAFEIASYRSLIAAAEERGLPEIKRLCEDNLGDEQAMAAWLEDCVSDVTRQYLQRNAQAGSVRASVQ